MIPFVASFIEEEEVGSTSDLARQLVLEANHPLPLVVTARRQTNGRGRGENRWWSDEGSLTFTLAIDPVMHGLRREQEPLLTLVAALVLIETLETLLPAGSLSIRWPNDVEASGKKLAGLLPERVEVDSKAFILLGIGLNVGTDLSRASQEIRRMAVSLDELAGRTVEPRPILESFLEHLPDWFGRLASFDPGLARQWAERDALLGQPVTMRVGERLIHGTGAGISPYGGLVLSNGSTRSVYYGGQVIRE